MSAKVVIFFALVAVASAGILQGAYYPQPTIIKKIIQAEAPANYDFNYAVNEPSTGDVKSQQEKAINGVIKGSYQLNDADGFLRIVDYTADDINGFQANVRREPLNVKVVHKIIAQPQAGPWW